MAEIPLTVAENSHEAVLQADQVLVINAVSPKVNLERTDDGLIVSVIDYRGGQTEKIFDGEKGAKGDNYVLTDSDKQEIAEIAATDIHVPAKISELQNDAGFITGYTETDPTVPQWAKNPTKPTYTAQEVGALPDDTSIPTKVSDLTDDSGHYTKPAGGIPASDLAAGVIPSVPVQDVQVNGASVLVNGVANVPSASANVSGVIKVGSGLNIVNGELETYPASSNNIKAAYSQYVQITPSKQHESVFYGLAKAAGDTTQASSSNTVGNYTENAKSAISEMLCGAVTVSGSTPSITAKAGVRYVCGTVDTLTFTPSATGICDVLFLSGSTPTVLTVPNTVKWPDWFNPTALEANATYEINILNGTLGVVGVWS